MKITLQSSDLLEDPKMITSHNIVFSHKALLYFILMFASLLKMNDYSTDASTIVKK